MKHINSHGLDNIGGLAPSLYSRAAVTVVKLHHNPCHKRERSSGKFEWWGTPPYRNFTPRCLSLIDGNVLTLLLLLLLLLQGWGQNKRGYIHIIILGNICPFGGLRHFWSAHVNLTPYTLLKGPLITAIPINLQSWT